MSVHGSTRPDGRGARLLFTTILVVNLIVFLFPPIHLAMNDGNLTHALLYFLGAPVLLIISMFVLMAIDPNRCPEDAS